MKHKLSVSYERMKGFYSLPKNTLDIAFIGTSHFYYGIVPMKLWQDYGVTSYVLAQEGQPFVCSYFYIKELLKYQKPEFIVLDVLSLLWYKHTPVTSTIHKSVDYMKWGKNKLDAISTMVSDEDMYDYFNAYLEHDATAYTSKSYQDIYNSNEFVTGDLYSIWLLKKFEKFSNVNKIVEVDENFNINIEQNYAPLEKRYIAYINKIVDLATLNNVKLVFVNMPYAPISGHNMFSEQIEQILRERKIDFLDFNRSCICDTLDLKTDFYNKDHLNYWGATKITKRIGEVIIANTLKDKRDNPSYHVWNKYNLFYTKRYCEIMKLEYVKKEERKRLDAVCGNFFKEDFSKYVENNIDVGLIYSLRSRYYGDIDVKIAKHNEAYCMKLDYKIEAFQSVSIIRVFIKKAIKDWTNKDGIEIVLISDNFNSCIQIKIWDCIEQELASDIYCLTQNKHHKLMIYNKDLTDPRIKIGYDKCPPFVFSDVNFFEICILNNSDTYQHGSMLIESIKLF